MPFESFVCMSDFVEIWQRLQKLMGLTTRGATVSAGIVSSLFIWRKLCEKIQKCQSTNRYILQTNQMLKGMLKDVSCRNDVVLPHSCCF